MLYFNGVIEYYVYTQIVYKIINIDIPGKIINIDIPGGRGIPVACEHV